MTNAQITTRVLATLDPMTCKEIIDSIAEHYGIDSAAALEAITDPDAEHLLDYLTGTMRTATRLMMKIHGLSA